MGSKVKQRDVANQKATQATLSVNERILKECHNLYTEADNGLIEVSDTMNFLVVFIDHDDCLAIDRLVKASKGYIRVQSTYYKSLIQWGSYGFQIGGAKHTLS